MPDLGPCTDWITGDDVAACCSVETTDGSIFDDAAEKAQQLLYELSGRLFAGECERTVRPCRTNCGCGWQVLSRGHLVSWRHESWYCDENPCGCAALSRVALAGPVREVSEVKIDGAVVDAATYRIERNRWLVRVRDPADPDTALSWPGCQNLDLEDTEEGTFSITYTVGRDAPALGVEAAAQLACEIYKACDSSATCALPSGVTRIIRQGLTIEKAAFAAWAYQPGSRSQARGWRTGLSLVDAFLNAYNPAGVLRPPIFWAPSTTRRYAPPEFRAGVVP